VCVCVRRLFRALSGDGRGGALAAPEPLLAFLSDHVSACASAGALPQRQDACSLLHRVRAVPL
jgi:hypothetical protein